MQRRGMGKGQAARGQEESRGGVVFWWAGGWQRHSGNMVVKGGYSKHSKTRGRLGYGCLPACLP